MQLKFHCLLELFYIILHKEFHNKKFLIFTTTAEVVVTNLPHQQEQFFKEQGMSPKSIMIFQPPKRKLHNIDIKS